jgi:hypothetical protein
LIASLPARIAAVSGEKGDIPWKEVMGHESLTTTVGYLYPETAQIKVAIDRLNQQKYVV